jgi:transcriptional regulator with XRE-family HTH domain
MTVTRSATPVPRGEMEASIGARFRDIRKGCRVALKPLAAHLRCSVNTVRWHEAGARMMRADLIVRAAEFMAVNPQELLPPAGKQEAKRTTRKKEAAHG